MSGVSVPSMASLASAHVVSARPSNVVSLTEVQDYTRLAVRSAKSLEDLLSLYEGMKNYYLDDGREEWKSEDLAFSFISNQLKFLRDRHYLILEWRNHFFKQRWVHTFEASLIRRSVESQLRRAIYDSKAGVDFDDEGDGADIGSGAPLALSEEGLAFLTGMDPF